MLLGGCNIGGSYRIGNGPVEPGVLRNSEWVGTMAMGFTGWMLLGSMLALRKAFRLPLTYFCIYAAKSTLLPTYLRAVLSFIRYIC